MILLYIQLSGQPFPRRKRTRSCLPEAQRRAATEKARRVRSQKTTNASSNQLSRKPQKLSRLLQRTQPRLIPMVTTAEHQMGRILGLLLWISLGVRHAKSKELSKTWWPLLRAGRSQNDNQLPPCPTQVTRRKGETLFQSASGTPRNSQSRLRERYIQLTGVNWIRMLIRLLEGQTAFCWKRAEKLQMCTPFPTKENRFQMYPLAQLLQHGWTRKPVK